MEEPPQFNFKIISTFKDPLTRQIAESVRIDRRGQYILNFKAEYLRCRVPRHRVIMEERRNKVKEDVQVVLGQELSMQWTVGWTMSI